MLRVIRDFSDVAIGFSGAALDSYPGSALLLGNNGVILAANPGSDILITVVRDDAQLRALVASAVRAGTTHRTFLEVQTAHGLTLLDIVLMPTGDGSGVLVLGRDQTLELNLRTALVESRRRYKDLVEIFSDFVWECNEDGVFVFVSGKKALGFQVEDLIGSRPAMLLLDPRDTDVAATFTTRVPVEETLVWLKRADGEPACLSAAAMPLFAGDGSWRGARGVCRDVTEARERHAVLASARHRDRLLAYVVRSFYGEVEPEKMLETVVQSLARSVGASGCQIFSLDHNRPPYEAFQSTASFGECGNDEALAPVLASFRSGGERIEILVDNWQILAAVTRANDEINGCVCLWRRLDREPWHNDERHVVGAIAGLLGAAIAKVIQHVAIVNLSRTDGLTGLLNRRAFMDDLGRYFPRFRKDRVAGALMFVDLDNFKLVNDRHGHQRGDEALIKVRDLLVGVTRVTDLVARLGGDEFAVWLDGAEVEVAVERARTLLERGNVLHGFSGDPERLLQMSIGIAVYSPAHEESLEVLLARADSAMYAVKRAGKGNFLVAEWE